MLKTEGGCDRRPPSSFVGGAYSVCTSRRNRALSSGMAVLIYMPLPISKPAVRTIRGMMVRYQWKNSRCPSRAGMDRI